MNGKTLLLSLALLAVLVAVFFLLPRGGGGAALGTGSDLEREGSEGRDVVIHEMEAGKEGAGVFSENTRKSDRAGEGNLVAAEKEAMRARLREMLRRDDEGLEIVTMPDGHQSIDLKGRFQHVTRLVRAEDGTLVPVCGLHMPEEVAGE